MLDTEKYTEEIKLLDKYFETKRLKNAEVKIIVNEFLARTNFRITREAIFKEICEL